MSEVSSPSAQALSYCTYWNSPSDIKIFPEISFEEFMDNGGLKKWLGYIQKNGFVLVTGTPASADATKELMERMAYVRNSIFGGFSVWDNKLEAVSYTHLRAHET